VLSLGQVRVTVECVHVGSSCVQFILRKVSHDRLSPQNGSARERRVGDWSHTYWNLRGEKVQDGDGDSAEEGEWNR